MNLPARVAIVGCGAVSEIYYAPALKTLCQNNVLKVTALIDNSPEQLLGLAELFPDAITFTQLESLPTQEIDLAIVATPPRLHAEHSIQLLQAGVSVLCEKPLATSVTEAESMLEVFANTSGVFAICLPRRLLASVQTINEILAQRLLGELKYFDFSEGQPFSWPVKSPTYFSKQNFQGVLMDIGIHVFDLTLNWFGQPAEIYYQDDAMGGVEANCITDLKFNNGLSGKIRLSRDCELANRFHICGEHGWLSWDFGEPNRLQLNLNTLPYAFDANLHAINQNKPIPNLSEMGITFEQSFISQISNVIAAIKGKEELIIPASSGVPSLAMVEYCYKNRTLMPMPWLDESNLMRSCQLGENL